ncbi:HU family DNA-binding protein [Nocardioides carbamazepini]|uniref:HU family DNA-binding protein n=1 Tax=Nocardioides carbamazepini TaxID=2854259 RepID=UPI00214A0175|nr:HU family DNA-binding protein [Nocardioides carbamazepini]MCR1782536.1 HU family DNA-binding protein [Nocardioides carbamazepini]
MNKSQLIDALADRFEGSRKDAAHALDAVLDTITRQVAKGEKVAITGFGSFEKAVRNARWVRNPQTGERVKTKKKAVPKFSAGADLKNVVSGAKKLAPLPKPAKKAAAPAKKAATTAAKKAAAPAKKAASTAKKAAAPAKKAAAAVKKAPAKKAPAKKAPVKKAPAKKAPAKKAPVKKAPAKKAPAKKAPAKKAPAKKAPAKKA